jgi:hypothetical protein
MQNHFTLFVDIIMLNYLNHVFYIHVYILDGNYLILNPYYISKVLNTTKSIKLLTFQGVVLIKYFFPHYNSLLIPHQTKVT